MAEYLLELCTDELAASRLEAISEVFVRRVFEELVGRGLAPGKVITGATPRRLVLALQDLPEHEPSGEQQLLGPPVAESWDEAGEPTAALAGFLARAALPSADRLRRIRTEKGEYLGVTRHVEGRPLAAVLGELVPRLLAEMGWRDSPPAAFPARLRGVLSLLDGKLLEWRLGTLRAGRSTAGHPRLSPGTFTVKSFADYRRRLGRLGIEISFSRRRSKLDRKLRAAAAGLGAELVGGDRLLDRLSASCEIPGVVQGDVESDFLTLPSEVVVATLNRLGAFALRAEGELLANFLTVMDRRDDPQGRVREGWQRTVAGHLIDARFAERADRKLPLAERARRLGDLVLHPRLGTYAQKSERLVALVELICSELDWPEELDGARQAATLAKADLTTAMVRQHPTLSGVVGGIYARGEGYVEAVWQAIYDQNQPLTWDDPPPRGAAGQVLAVADRVDTLVGFLGIGELPSGSRDPQGLKRLTQGLLRVVLDGGLELDLDLLAARTVLLYAGAGTGSQEEGAASIELQYGAEELVELLRPFLADRLRHVLGQRGHAHDEIEAVMAVAGNSLPDLEARLFALRKVRGDRAFASLVQAAKRISNIISAADEHPLRVELLTEPAERELNKALEKVRGTLDQAVAKRLYAEALRRMAALARRLDQFFNEVLVMDEDEALRHNRLALLQATHRVFWRVARLQEMAVEEMPVGEMPVGEMPVEEMPVKEKFKQRKEEGS